MREPVLKAVANPPKILWGPFLLVLLNLGLQFPIMFVAIGAFELNPIIFVISILLTHLVVIFWGTKEPHISTMIQAYGQTYRITKNLYKAKGNKFAP